MDKEQKFWIAFWSVVGTVILSLVGLGVYSGYLDDKRDTYYVDKGLQPYKVTTCKEYSYNVEWHEAGWSNPNTVTILKD